MFRMITRRMRLALLGVLLLWNHVTRRPCCWSIQQGVFTHVARHLCKYFGTKEIFYLRKGFNSHRAGLEHQHGRRFIVLEHQHSCHDINCKPAIYNIKVLVLPVTRDHKVAALTSYGSSARLGQ